MKKILVIGSTVLDIIIHITHLPSCQEDLHIKKQTMSLGGCAFNVYHTINLFHVPSLLCSPVGSGFYGDYVAKELEKKGIRPFIRMTEKDNGCCYCYVDPEGERSFLSYHGAEYEFYESFLNSVNMNQFDSIYICGLEIEAPTGSNIIEFLKKHTDMKIFFAPGPRLLSISESKLNSLFALSPVLHLNHKEILSFTYTTSIEEGVKILYQKNHNLIVVTDGEKGSYAYNGKTLIYVPSILTRAVDTIGAGDSHIGAFIAARKSGYTVQQSLQIANQIASKVVATQGSLLSEKDFHWELNSY